MASSQTNRKTTKSRTGTQTNSGNLASEGNRGKTSRQTGRSSRQASTRNQTTGENPSQTMQGQNTGMNTGQTMQGQNTGQTTGMNTGDGPQFYAGNDGTILGALQDGLMRLIGNRPAVDMTLRQVAILNGIYHSDGQHTVRGIATHLNMTKPAVTRAVQRMEKLSFVTKRTDPRDRRVVRVALTARGRTWMEHIESGLPPERRSQKTKTTRAPKIAAGVLQQATNARPTHPGPQTTH
jgi:DNA-binding MarR family transcriptional regulator